MLLDSFPCIVLVSVPPFWGTTFGKGAPSNSCQPASTYCEAWGDRWDQATRNRRWQNMLGTQGFPEAEVVTSSGHPMPCNCLWDQGLQLGGCRATGMHRCGIFWLRESGSTAAGQPVLQLRRRHTEAARLYTRAAALHPASHSAPPWASHSARGRRYFPPGRWARSSRGRNRAAFPLLLWALQGPRWPLAAARWAERASSRSASWLQGIGRLRVGTRGDKAGSPRPVPTGPRGRLSFCSRLPLTDAQGGLVCGPGAFPGWRAVPRPRRDCFWFVHDLPVWIRAIGPRPL